MVIINEERMTPKKSYSKQYYTDYCKAYWKSNTSKKQWDCHFCKSTYNVSHRAKHLKTDKHRRNELNYKINMSIINNDKSE